jgi:solute carrier family 25 protein 39/40
MTHPFDVIKTIYQISNVDQIQKSVVGEIYRQNGFRGFWIGLGPRLVKAAPASGIMISTYEIGKRLLGSLQ